jgi:hypothetical protein
MAAAIRPPYGYRSWELVISDSDAWLRSPVRTDGIWAGRFATADTLPSNTNESGLYASDFNEALDVAYVQLELARAHLEAVPDGFWRIAFITMPVVGAVVAGGEVIFHKEGWRAEDAEIVAIANPYDELDIDILICRAGVDPGAVVNATEFAGNPFQRAARRLDVEAVAITELESVAASQGSWWSKRDGRARRRQARIRARLQRLRAAVRLANQAELTLPDDGLGGQPTIALDEPRREAWTDGDVTAARRMGIDLQA